MKLAAHLRSRGMNPRLYRIAYCYSTNKITFPLYNYCGHWTGFQTYRPLITDKGVKNNPKRGRYYTRLKYNKIGVFGLECLDHSQRTLYVLESCIQAGNLHRLGFNAIAVLTSTPKHLKSWFKIMKSLFDLVAIGDNDKAGQQLVKIVGKGFCSPADLDEMNDRDILEMLSNK